MKNSLVLSWGLGCWLFQLMALAEPVADRTITVEEALQSTKQNNLTWQSLKEYLEQAQAGVDIGIGLFLPKLTAEGSWLHLGERHTPDMSGLEDMGALLGELVGGMIEKHPDQASRFLPYMGMAGSGGADTFSNFIPPSDTFAALFSVIVPVLNPQSIPNLRGATKRRDAVVQQIGHGREQLLYAVASSYLGLCTLQTMVEVAKRSIEAAEEHHRSSQVRAGLQAATQLEVKRAELEVKKNETRKVELKAALEKAKAGFCYLTGLTGSFALAEPNLEQSLENKPEEHFQALAQEHRKDLLASHLEVLVAEQEHARIKMKYLPSLNLFGQFKLDNAKEQRFDDDPASWTVGANLSMNLWDGGIREAELRLARSRLNQARLAETDQKRKIESEVKAAHQALQDAIQGRQLADKQLQVALDTQRLAKVSESAGVVTYLEVIDTNTMVFASEAQYQTARLKEAQAQLELLSACGSPIPFEVPD